MRTVLFDGLMSWMIVAVGLLAAPAVARVQEEAEEEDPIERRIYRFQHRLLPAWTHQKDSSFYEDLRAGRTQRLRDAAEKIIGKEYAAGLKVRAIKDAPMVLIEFPEPMEAPLCYFALIIKTEDGFRYMTLEKTFPHPKSNIKTVVGEWKPGSHTNWGGREYTDADSFVKEFVRPDGKPTVQTAPAIETALPTTKN